jgi:carbonic anhydrase
LTAEGFKDVGHGPGSREAEYINWLTFKNAEQAVLDDVARIKSHPLVPKTIPVHGYIYDVKTRKLVEVEGAKAIGAAG